jgi:hypothetical protein
MNRRRIIRLKHLARSHSAEIKRTLAGIHRNPGSSLWTSEMRATTRGGKCLVVPLEDGSPQAPNIAR